MDEFINMEKDFTTCEKKTERVISDEVKINISQIQKESFVF